MKLKTKFAALAATVCLLGGALVGCGDDPEPTPVVNKYYVTLPQASDDFTVAGINAEGYDAGATVTFTVTMKTEMKVVKNVKWDTTVITAGTDGSYSFTMPEKNVTITVNLDSYALSIVDGKLEVGETAKVKLTLGNEIISDFSVAGKTDADKAKITLAGSSITFNEVGDVTLVASRLNKVVAEKKFTIGESTKETITKAIADVWAKGGDFADNSKNTKTDERYTLVGQVVAKGNPYTKNNSTTVELLIDDGSGIILDYLVYLESATEEWTACQVGDVIKINEKLVNYYGVFEAVSSKQQFITVVQDAVTPLSLTKVTSVEQYNGLVADLGDASKMHKPVPMELVVKGAPEDTKNRFKVEGVTGDAGTLALTKSGIEIKCVAGASYTIKGYMIGKGGSGYYNFFAISQESNDQVESVTIKGDSERTLKVNETLKLEYETTPAGAGNTVEWVSSDSTKVKVENGTVTALVKGASETIKVIVDGHESNTITINVPNINVTALEISGELTTKEYCVGEALNVAGLKVTATFDDESTDDTYADKVEWVVNPATFTEEGEAVSVSVVAKLGEVESAAFEASVKVTLEDGYDADHPMMADKAYAKASKMASGAETAKEYYIKGVVVSKGNWSDKYKNVSVDLDAGNGNKFVLYRVAAETQADADAYVKGAVVLAKAKITNYNGTCETVAAPEIVSMTATEVALVEITGSSTVGIGKELQLTAATYPQGIAATVVWASDSDTIATVDQTGKVEGVAEGTATITATVGEVVASKEVEVASAGYLNAETTVLDYATANSWKDATKYLTMNVDSNISVTLTGGNNTGKFYTNGNNWRVYQNESPSITVAAASGYEIVSVAITYKIDKTGILLQDTTQIESGTTVNVGAASIVFGVGNTGTANNGQVRITAIAVVYQPVE